MDKDTFPKVEVQSIRTFPGISAGRILPLLFALLLIGMAELRGQEEEPEISETLGIDPPDVAPEHWRHLNNRISVNELFRIYSHEQHRAWLLRREVSR